MPRRSAWLWAAQAVVTLLVLAFVVRALARQWSEFRSLHLELAWHPVPIAAAAGLTFATYALQVASWRAVLRAWEQALTYSTAARIWCLANLARYVPGKVWGVAGLVVLAQRSGVAPWASAASTVVVQAIGLATAVAVVAAAAPAGTTSPLQLGLAAVAAVATLTALASRRAGERITARLRLPGPWRPLPWPSVLAAAGFTLASWITYGLGFWLLALGLGLSGLAWPAAAGTFALGYILGLLALFAPGGLGVREAALVALLAPSMGAGVAVALSIASRIMLTLTEAIAALVAVLVERHTRSGGGQA